MAIRPGGCTVQQRPTALLRCPAKQQVHQPYLQPYPPRSVAGELRFAESRAEDVDDDVCPRQWCESGELTESIDLETFAGGIPVKTRC